MGKRLGEGDAKSARHRGRSKIGTMAGMDVAKRKDEQRRMWMLAGLGALVVLFTALALMLPAISMTKGDLICGLEEHTHTEACYEEVLTCGEEENADHEHSEDCYEKELVCDKEEHEHTDACYAPVKDEEPKREAKEAAEEAAPEPEPEPAAEPESPSVEDEPESQAADEPKPEPAYEEEIQPEQDEPVQEKAAAAMPAQQFYGELRDKNDKVTLTVDVDAPEGALPEGATMEVKSVKAKDVKDAIQDALDAEDAGKLDTVQAVDITFKDAYGNEVEPAATVNVKLASPQIGKAAADDREPLVAHVDDKGKAELVDVLTDKQLAKRDIQREDDELLFDADAFSVYAIVYTVDFHYSVDGEEREVNIAGGSTASLREILVSLGVIEDDELTAADETKLYMEAIQSVDFSDLELVSVTPVQEATTVGALKKQLALECEYSSELSEEEIANIDAQELAPVDWALISLKPFTSEETLTITMQDGQVLTLRVTDRLNNGQYEVWLDGTLGQSAQDNKFYQGANNLYQAVNNGTEITLPDVGGNFGNGKVSMPSQYDYKLNGWYDITGKKLYKPGDKVTITKDTVFYADWVPASYSKGSEQSAPVVTSADTSEFVTTELFDYNELINANFTKTPAIVARYPNPYYPGSPRLHVDTWTADGPFQFISWNYNWNPQNSIGMPGSREGSSEYQGASLSTGIYSNNASTIQMLFSNDEMVGKTVVGTGNYLFQYDETTGYYYYDSGKNAATYHGDGNGSGRFYVYQTGKPENLVHDNKNFTNFLPFNDYPGGNAPNENTGATNYWFGMKNTIDFYLPDNVGTAGGNKDSKNKEDMVFKFSGDDDVWVFVDGKLVLDLGGIHDRAGGTINFATGEVTTYFGEIDKPEAGAPTNKFVDPNLSSLTSGNHKLEVLYLERGSSLSNCAIYFNLLPQRKSIEIEKRLAGMTAADRLAYKDTGFDYLVYVQSQGGQPVLYNTPANPLDRQKATKYTQDGNSSLLVIEDGKVSLKDGERIVLPNLLATDKVYVVEKGLNMALFENPSAQETYVDASGASQNQNLMLEASGDDSAKDWKTPLLDYHDQEKVVFTNSLKERQIRVNKIWEGDESKRPSSVTFTVAATVDGKAFTVEALRDNDGKAKEFTITGDSWTTLIEHLPAVTPEGKEITYSVTESEVVGYDTSYATPEYDEASRTWTHQITNKEKKPGKITIEKQWQNSDGSPMKEGHPDSISYNVYQFSHVHEWGEWKVVKAATETEEGLERQVCKYDSSHVNERVIAKKDHVHVWKTEVVKPTCTEQGYTQHICENDQSHNYKDAFTDPIGHDWDNGVITAQATCQNQGVKTYTCTNDSNHKKYEAIPALGHEWSAWEDTGKTKTVDGKQYRVMQRKCSRCNEVETYDKPDSVYPGTDIPLDEVLNWPTESQYDGKDGRPKNDTKITMEPTGIFKYEGAYYVIHKTVTNAANQFYQNGGGPGAINNNNGNIDYIVKLSGDVYKEPVANWETYKTKTKKIGDVYITQDGKAYVFISNDPNNLHGKPGSSDADSSRWYLVYDPTQGQSSAKPAPARPAAKLRMNAAKVNAAPQSVDSGATGADEAGTANAFVWSNVTEQQLLDHLNVSKLGEIDPNTGNYLALYSEGSGTLETKGNMDSWSKEISVPLEDEHGNKYTYYVLETVPEATSSSEWDTTYIDEDNGLENDGKVTIINKKRSLKVDITILKVDEKNQGLAGASFTLQKKSDGDGSFANVTTIVPDVTGLDQNSSFTSTTAAITIGNLTDGEYKLIENSAPNGYIVGISDVDFKIENGKIIGADIADKVTFGEDGLSITVINKPGKALPSTGGFGLGAIYLVAGLMLALSAALFLQRGSALQCLAPTATNVAPPRRRRR